MTTKALALANLIGANNKINLQALPEEATEKGTSSFSDANSLPLSGNTVGDQAFVEGSDRLYIWNGSGWYNIALINTNPSFDSGGGPEVSYELDSAGGSPTVITLLATDPEEVPITYSAIPSDSAQYFADITQNGNQFTITAKDTSVIEQYDSGGGMFSVTFRASDGVNLATALSEFTIDFSTGGPFLPSGATLSATVNISTVSTSGGGESINDAGSINFKPDGTRMYILRSTNFSERLFQFDLSTPWDISTATYAGDTRINQVPLFLSHGIHFKPDGTRFYSVSYQNNSINLRYYNLSTPWDVSSHSRSGGNADGATTLSGLSVPKDLFIKPDGTKIYIVGGDASAPAVFDLGTPWEFTGGATLNISDRLVDSSFQALSVFFNSDGTLMFILDRENNRISRFDLSTPWIPSTGVITNELYMSSLGITIGYWGWISISEDGTRLYYTDETSNIYEFLLSS